MTGQMLNISTRQIRTAYRTELVRRPGYLKEAFDSLQEGEILIAGVNNGGEQAGRTFLNGFRKIGLTVVLKNILD